MVFPKPLFEEKYDGEYTFVADYNRDLLDFYKDSDNLGICYKLNTELDGEEYEISVNSTGVEIMYSCDEGKFRALTSLRQMAKCGGGKLKYCKIHDKPDIKRRGYMLDISRGRMPKMETLLGIVDLLADLKYNEFQLYMDNFCFKYSAFPEVTKDFECLTPEDIEFLDKYCSDRFIDLVPNQNSFGHMKAWLGLPQYEHLALSGDGERTQTLNPLLPETVELMDKIYGSLLPHFKSKYVHIGLDEAFGFGKYQTKEACDKYGAENVFVEYLTKLNDIVNNKYGKEILFWDDMIISYPDSFPKFPKNATAVEWGYGIISTQFMEERCRVLNNSGVRFYVCPGNATWQCLTSRVDVMEFNIRTAGELAKKYGASGYLLSDWGMSADGHMQFFVSSYFPCAMAAQYAWNSGVEQDRQNFKNDFRFAAMDYLDRNVFRCKGATELMYRLGKYHHLEPHKTHGLTMSAYVLLMPLSENKGFTFDLDNCGDDFYFDNVINYVSSVAGDIKASDMDERLKKEILTNAEMILIGAELCKVKTHKKITDEKRDELVGRIDDVIEEYKELWLYRNFENGMEISVGKLLDRKKEILDLRGECIL